MGTPSVLEQIWELFLQYKHCSVEKSTWLDILLAELLSQIKEGENISDVLSFCSVGSVSTLIACEFLADVKEIGSICGDVKDLDPLLGYLQKRRGWRCLAVLQHLGVENLSCGILFTNILITIFPACLQCSTSKSRSSSQNPYLPQISRLCVEEIVEVQTPLCLKFHTHQLSSSTKDHSEHSCSVSTKNVSSKSPNKSCELNCDQVSSDSKCDYRDDFDVLNNKPVLKIHFNPMDFDYFTSVVRSNDEARLESHSYIPCSKPKQVVNHWEIKANPENFKHKRVKLVLESEVNGYELCQMVVDLLQSLNLSELSVFYHNKYHAKLKSVTLSLDNISALQFNTDPSLKFSPSQNNTLKLSLLKLLVTCLEKGFSNSEFTKAVIENVNFSIIRNILEEAVRIHSGLVQLKNKEQEVAKNQEFIFGILYSMILILYCALLQKSSLDKDFCCVLDLFSESIGKNIIEKSISCLLSLKIVKDNKSVFYSSLILDLVGQLIGTFKKIRSENVCSHRLKSKHKKINVSKAIESHHHHDLFGNVYSVSSNVSNECLCCVSSLYMILLKLLDEHPVLESIILKQMAKWGTCCCFPTEILLSVVFKILERTTPNNRSLVFMLLEKKIYVELGFIVKGCPLSCVICSKHSADHLLDLGGVSKWYNCTEPKPSGNLEVNITPRTSCAVNEKDKNPWKCMSLFANLFEIEDVKLQCRVISHLLKSISQFTVAAKEKIFFNVFYPVFIKVKPQYFDKKCERSRFIILASLSLFSSLLNNIRFAEQFILMDGLSHISEIVWDPVFCRLSCSILEILSKMRELWQLKFEGKQEQEVDGMKCNSDVQLKTFPCLKIFQSVLLSCVTNLLCRMKRDVIVQRKENDCNIENEMGGKCNKMSYLCLLEYVCHFLCSSAALSLFSYAYCQKMSHLLMKNEGCDLLRNILQRISNGCFVAGNVDFIL